MEAVILDFYHPSEHLGVFAKAWCAGTEAAAAQHQHAEWSHRLKHEGGEAVLNGTAGPGRRREVHERWPACGGGSELLREPGCIGWTTRTIVAKGWQIGSGPVESACKTVVRQTDERIGDAVGP